MPRWRGGVGGNSRRAHQAPPKEVLYGEVHCMCALCVSLCVCATDTCSSQGAQKTASDPLKLELQVLLNLCVGAGNQTRSSPGVARAFSHWAICTVPVCLFI